MTVACNHLKISNSYSHSFQAKNTILIYDSIVQIDENSTYLPQKNGPNVHKVVVDQNVCTQIVVMIILIKMCSRKMR